jgi:hypothetical protein
LPWPLAQWALTTPLGIVALDVIGGLVCGAPLLLLALRMPIIIPQPVDVTDIPLYAWPRPLSRWGVPAGMTPTDRWLGRTQPQRVWSVAALALAALCLLSLVAATVVSVGYAFGSMLTLIPQCSPAGCAPNFYGELSPAPLFLGLLAIFLGLALRIAWVQRRCGVWFRSRGFFDSGLGTYIRRSGVTPEAAATALQRYTQVRRPLAPVILLAMLALIPSFLLLSGALLLSVWLSTQWIPR